MLGLFKRGHGLFLERHTDMDAPVGDIVRGNVHAVSGKEHVCTALKLCIEGHRNIPVTDERGEAFLGMMNSRILLDYLGGGSLHQIYRTRKHALKIQVSKLIETGHISLERNGSVRNALLAIRKTGEEAVPLVTKSRLDGMVSEADLVNQISGTTGVRVWEVMTSKPIVARNTHPVSEVAGMLVKGGYRRLPVVRDSFITGIVTPHDIIRYLNDNKKLDSLKKDRSEIEKAMNKFVATVNPEADVKEAIDIMRSKRIAMLPVVDEYQIMGVLTQRDIIDAM